MQKETKNFFFPFLVIHPHLLHIYYTSIHTSSVYLAFSYALSFPLSPPPLFEARAFHVKSLPWLSMRGCGIPIYLPTYLSMSIIPYIRIEEYISHPEGLLNLLLVPFSIPFALVTPIAGKVF
ncbi:hypothetical protein F4809DRAFT_593863 [Biscogniauxia mediterranea]|nr:hypothetical protein F4809DRAFT_593863 [Biscogniauxia mediterranea]